MSAFDTASRRQWPSIRVATTCLILSLAAIGFVFIARFHSVLSFSTWIFTVDTHWGPQTLSWGFFVIIFFIFSFFHFVFIYILFFIFGTVDFISIRGLLISAVSVVAVTVLASIYYFLQRPPNIPMDFPVLSGLVLFLFELVFVVIGMIKRKIFFFEFNNSESFKKLTAFCLGLFVTLILIETVLRIYNPFIMTVRGREVVLPFYQNLVYDNKNPIKGKTDSIVEIKRNSLGFRGEEPPVDFASRLTVIAIGGSTTQDLHLTDGKTWTDRMAFHLSDRIRGLWVNNAGLVGHSTFGHISLVKRYIKKIRPKVALFLIGINDVARDQGADFNPGAGINVSVGTERYDTNIDKERNFVRPSLEILATYSETGNVIWNLKHGLTAYFLGYSPVTVSALHSDPFRASIRALDSDRSRARRMANEAVVLELVRARQAAYQDRIMVLADEGRAAGIFSVFITQPLLWGEGIDPATGRSLDDVPMRMFARDVNSLSYWKATQIYNDTLRRVTLEHKFPLIDLARLMPKNSAYFMDWVHFGNDGADLVGFLVARDLCGILVSRFPAFSGPRGCTFDETRKPSSGVVR